MKPEKTDGLLVVVIRDKILEFDKIEAAQLVDGLQMVISCCKAKQQAGVTVGGLRLRAAEVVWRDDRSWLFRGTIYSAWRVGMAYDGEHEDATQSEAAAVVQGMRLAVASLQAGRPISTWAMVRGDAVCISTRPGPQSDPSRVVAAPFRKRVVKGSPQ